ncbi:ERO1-like protein beta [Rhodotorula toruloides]|uniref:ERO1-like protein beta n=1 Tax=Rhodotorula toruloides TaxID=5286 RepID=A0A511KCI4_RHOTO|nr:ERO1-like protein beta [Rhodotorula toruloides]
MRQPRPASPAAAAALAFLSLSSLASASSLDTSNTPNSDSQSTEPRVGFLQDVLSSRTAGQNYCKPTGQIHDACCDYETVESANEDLFGRLHALVAQPYFRYHKVDLAKECPFWEEDGSCMNRACGVETTDEDHIPEAWRSSTLGKLNRTSARTSSPAGCKELPDSDFCVLEDELDSEGVYVDLLLNPERFTGYAGPSSSRVWQSIYLENCFSPVPYIDPSRPAWEGGSGYADVSAFGGLGLGAGGGGLRMGGWGEGEKRLMGSLAGPKDPTEEVCLEKRVFYRVISGLHASISVHICDDYLDQTTGLWSPNLDCFVTRIGQHPERLENMYFTYVLLLRALSRAGPQLVRTLEATHAAGEEVRGLAELVNVAGGCPSTFDESTMFNGGKEAQLLKDEFKAHFRNVSRIMDCVGCDKCRLWGKMQITGLGTALKLLFSTATTDEGEVVLSRSEVVAFVNTLHRLSESLAAVDRFRTLWAHRNDAKTDASFTPSSSVSEPEPASPSRRPLASSRPSSLSTLSAAASPSPSPLARNTTSSLPALALATKVWTRLVGWCEGRWSRCVELVGGGSRDEL